MCSRTAFDPFFAPTVPPGARACRGACVGDACSLAVRADPRPPAAAAQAALLSSGGSCNESALSQPFAQWGDSNSYELVAQGDFEGSLSQWTLSGGATRGER